jgi:uncharacterized membrane protein YtjA (UPF0391 family)
MSSAVVARLLVLFVVIMVVISLVLTSIPSPLQ